MQASNLDVKKHQIDDIFLTPLELKMKKQNPEEYKGPKILEIV